jgi:SAM-dependent methyltransferase
MDASPWIKRFSHLVKGEVLDLACGSGRHGRLFLESADMVTLVDKNTDGVNDLSDHPSATVLERDLEDGSEWSFNANCFDAIMVTNYLYRPHLADMLGSLKDGGILLYETFAIGNEQFGRPRSPNFLLRSGELLELVNAKLQVIAYEHGIDGEKVVQRICAVKDTALARVD